MAPRLGYVVRFVAALDSSVDFYEGVLGLTLTRRTEHWAQFDCGSVRLGLYERDAMAAVLGVDGESLGHPPGAIQLSFEVDDVDSAHAAAVAAGAPSFQEPGDRYWGERTAYVLDPDGGLVELLTRIRR
jgi:lactoylglutathione lyase